MNEYHDFQPDQAEHNEATQTSLLDLSQLPIEVDIPDIDKFPNQAYALMRKNGFGGSDASAILGVSPFTDRNQLIADKIRPSLTAEDLAIGQKTAVIKGRELEPLIITKMTDLLKKEVFKPVDMYRFKDYPWLKINFDGVVDRVWLNNTMYQYIPSEIKVVTYAGMKHYNRTKAWYNEGIGFNPIPERFGDSGNPIQDVAAQYGIPPYYYTQLQQEMMALDAPFGWLGVLFDPTWTLSVWMIWKDERMQQALKLESYKVWRQVLAARSPDFDEVLANNIRTASVQPEIDNGPTSDAAYIDFSQPSSRI